MRVEVVLWLTGAFVAIALIPIMPYGYYPAMRWFVSGGCVWLAFNAHSDERENWVWIWGIAAGIYNPIVPVHSTREIWTVINIATIGTIVWYKFKILDLTEGK